VIVALVVVVFSFVMTFAIGALLQAAIGMRVSDTDEVSGIDLAQHGETAYEALGARVRTTEVKA